METCTAGSASGLEKRTSGNADTALQADSTNRRRQRWTSADTDGPWLPGQASRSAGSLHCDLASGRRGHVQYKDAQPR